MAVNFNFARDANLAVVGAPHQAAELTPDALVLMQILFETFQAEAIDADLDLEEGFAVFLTPAQAASPAEGLTRYAEAATSQRH